MGQVDILSASAGSGKTFRLAYRYITTLLEEPQSYRHILAVTFTNKATDELKGRILAQLNAIAEGRKSDFDERLQEEGYDLEAIRGKAALARNLILHDYDNFAVMTIDKFFQRVMRAFVKELGVELNFNLELKTDSLIDQAADRMLDEVAEDSDLYAWIMEYIGEKITDGESWNIKGAIASLGTQLFNEEYRHSRISRKDKPELRRILSEATAKAAKLKATYKKTAEEFTSLMEQHGLGVEDFKGGARTSVARYALKVASGEIAEPKGSAYAAAEEGQWHKAGKSPAYATIDSLSPTFGTIIRQLIDLYPQVVRTENTRKAIAGHYRDFALLADLRSRIDDICAEQELLPIADVGELISSLVADNDAPFIYEKSGNRYDHFMIDEFQDTSTMQWRNFVPLLHNALAQAAGSPVLLVGDVKQSIYRWRGGDWSLLADGVQREFSEVELEPLTINRRSGRNVVEFNNDLTHHAVEYISSQIAEEIHNALATGALSHQKASEFEQMVRRAYTDYKQQAAPNATEGYVSVVAYEPDTTPHPALARIEELQERGYRASDIAVLVRTNREARRIAAEILEYKNSPTRDPKYNFDIVTQEALAISSSSAVKFVMAILSLTANPDDKLARAFYNDYFSRPFEEPLSEGEREFIFSLSLLQPEEAFNEIMLRYPMLSSREEVPYLQALHSQIIAFAAGKVADTALFVRWWNESGSEESVALPQDADAITIITIHKSKGLGFKAVVIPYCNWTLRPMSSSIVWMEPNAPLSKQIGKFPVAFNKSVAQSDFSNGYYNELTMAAIDSLNALYVAITRAKQELHILLPDDAGATTVGAIVKSLTGVGESCREYSLGTPPTNTPEERPQPSLSHFNTHSPSEKIAVRYTHQRYDPESHNSDSLSPRDYGILMHRTMEHATTRQEMNSQIDAAIIDGILSETDAERLRGRIEEALQDERVAEWFDGSWELMLSEREIIDQGTYCRPDRVMVKEGRAVVVDYKFGSKTPAGHRHQIKAYADLLGRMGYERVEGYLWYITIGQVEQVV